MRKGDLLWQLLEAASHLTDQERGELAGMARGGGARGGGCGPALLALLAIGALLACLALYLWRATVEDAEALALVRLWQVPGPVVIGA